MKQRIIYTLWLNSELLRSNYISIVIDEILLLFFGGLHDVYRVKRMALSNIRVCYIRSRLLNVTVHVHLDIKENLFG